MGSGKSTVGKRLAEKLNVDFIDFDKHIEKETGKIITEIFDKDGEEKFRLLEHEYLKKLLNKENVIISLGGGTPCFHNNIHLINNNGISVYLEMSSDALVKRLLKAKNKRPLIRGLNEVDLRYFVEANLEKRKPVYQKANYLVPCDQLSADDISEKIITLIEREK